MEELINNLVAEVGRTEQFRDTDADAAEETVKVPKVYTRQKNHLILL